MSNKKSPMTVTFGRIHQAHIEQLFNYGSSPTLTQYLLWGPFKGVQEAEAFYHYLQQQDAWGIFIDGTLAGHYFFKDHDEAARTVKISYCISEDYWGRGVGSLMMANLLGYARQRYSNWTIIAVIYTVNEASMALVNRFGFHRGGSYMLPAKGGEVAVHDFLIVP